MRFYIIRDDPMITNVLGVYGNKYFGKLIYVFELDYQKGKLELIAKMPYSPATELLLKFYGYRNLTDKFEEIYGKKPDIIELFKHDISDIVETNKRLKLLIKKLIGQR